MARRYIGIPIRRKEDRWSLTGREHVCELEIAAERDGTILGMRTKIYGALGAHPQQKRLPVFGRIDLLYFPAIVDALHIVFEAIRRFGAATVGQADGEVDIQQEWTLLLFHDL